MPCKSVQTIFTLDVTIDRLEIRLRISFLSLLQTSGVIYLPLGSVRMSIQRAINDYKMYTCIRLVPKSRFDKNYVIMHKGSG